MANKGKAAPAPLHRERSAEWIRGAFDALRAARRGTASMCPDSEEMERIAELLDVPVLFVEASQSYDSEALDDVAAWWPMPRCDEAPR